MQYDLVFEGGGAKGTVFAGALKEFARRGHTHGRLLGTSAGAIVSTLLAAGYSVAEIMAALGETKPDGKSIFNDFLAPPNPISEELLDTGALAAFLQNVDVPLVPEFIEKPAEQAFIHLLAKNLPSRYLVSFIELGGLFSADFFVEWLSGKLDEGEFNGQKRNFSKMTLAEFYDATGCDLSLCATDITDHLLLVLNHRTAPQLPVVRATRMSMSIPMLWQEVVWREEWGMYRERDMKDHSIVDGGVLSNFPIELFISDLKTVTDLMGEKTSDEILGMLIDEQMDVPGAAEAPATGIMKLGELKSIQRIGNLVTTMMEARDKAVISAFSSKVVRLPAKGFGTTEFDMPPARRQILIDAGEKSMKLYFDKQDAEAAMPSFSVEPPTSQDMADEIASRMLK